MGTTLSVEVVTYLGYFGLLALAGVANIVVWARGGGRRSWIVLAICLAPPLTIYALVTVRLLTADPTDMRNFGLDILWGGVGAATMFWALILAGCAVAGLIWRRLRRRR